MVRLEKLDFRTMTGVTLLTVADNGVNGIIGGLNKLWLAKNKILILVFFLQSLYDIFAQYRRVE